MLAQPEPALWPNHFLRRRACLRPWRYRRPRPRPSRRAWRQQWRQGSAQRRRPRRGQTSMRVRTPPGAGCLGSGQRLWGGARPALWLAAALSLPCFDVTIVLSPSLQLLCLRRLPPLLRRHGQGGAAAGGPGPRVQDLPGGAGAALGRGGVAGVRGGWAAVNCNLLVGRRVGSLVPCLIWMCRQYTQPHLPAPSAPSTC